MERDYFEDLHVYGKVMLKWILQKRNGKTWNWIQLAQAVEK